MLVQTKAFWILSIVYIYSFNINYFDQKQQKYNLKEIFQELAQRWGEEKLKPENIVQNLSQARGKTFSNEKCAHPKQCLVEMGRNEI